MTVNLDAIGTETAPVDRSWTSKDALLYAVGVGAGAEDPLAELQYTTENSRGVDQEVLPTFGVIVGGGLPPLAAVGEINMAALVHGEQGIELYRPIPPDGSVRTTSPPIEWATKRTGCVLDSRAASAASTTWASRCASSCSGRRQSYENSITSCVAARCSARSP